MAHFAKIENGVVVDVIVVDNEFEEVIDEYLLSLGIEGTWVQTSYNGNTRGKYAAIGDLYDAEADLFVAPPVETSQAIEVSPEEVTTTEAVAGTE